MNSVIQRSLAGGELTPAAYGRTDLQKYQTGLKRCVNFILLRHGGASNRSGTEIIAEVKDSNNRVKMIRFKFNADQTYTLEFGDFYMRVIRQGVQLTVSGLAAYNGGTTYALSDMVSFGGSNYYSLASSNVGHTPNINPAWWYLMPASGIYEIPTPYAVADVPDLQYTQSGDIITIVHPSYDVVELRRTGHTAWSMVFITYNPMIDRPTACAGVLGAAGALTFNYKIVAIATDSLEESLPGIQATKVITAITAANPPVVSSVAHGFANGDEIYIDNVVGMTEVNQETFIAAGVAANTFQLQGINGTAYSAYVSGGIAARIHVKISAAATPTTANPNTLSWTAPTQSTLEYDVFRQQNGKYGYIGTTSIASFSDSNITPDLTDSPPIYRNPFHGDDDKPSTVTYARGRQIFGSTNNDPEKIFMTRAASFHNFTYSSPLQDDDSMTFPVVGKEVNQIKHIIDLNDFIVLTSGGEWVVEGDDTGIIKPNAINPKQRNYYGSAAIAPVIIGNSLIYVQARQSIVRDYRFEIQSNGYVGKDLTVFAAHLFDNFTLTALDYQQIPHSIVWAIRDDGVLLGMTYIRDQDVWGWHQHTTDGEFEDVLVVPEDGNYGSEDFVYVVVKRVINGVTKRFIERMASRKLKKENIIDDAWFVDCGLMYDGRNTNVSLTMTLTGGITWLVDELEVLTASAGFFVAGDVGNSIILYTTDAEGLPVSLELVIVSFTSTTVVGVRPDADVDVVYRAAPFTNWARAVDVVTGADHLEAKRVAVFADGYSVSDGVNGADYTVTAGRVEFNERYVVIKVGLPYISDLKTLDIDVVNGETVRDKQKLTGKISILYQDSRGTFVAADEDSEFSELKQRDDEDDWGPIEPFTGTEEINLDNTWETTGSLLVRQRDPLPITVLAVIPAVTLGG